MYQRPTLRKVTITERKEFETSFNHLFEFQQCLEDHSLLF